MADDVTLPATGAVIATDDVGGRQMQVVKLDVGGNGVSVPVEGTVPVSGTVSVSNLPATQTVSGTVAVSNLPATQTVAGTVAVSNLPATQPVSGTVSVGNFPATQTVAGSVSVSNFPATQPVSGTVAVSNFPATQPVSGTVAVSNFPATQPVSAAALPLPAGAATEATVAAGNALLTTIDADTSLLAARTPALLSTIPPDLTAGVPVRPVPVDLWRVSFADSGAGVPSADMALLQTGAGMTVSQASSSLVVATGTTANAETLIRSARTFRGAHMLRYRLQLSQRIANQTFELALADTVGEGLAYTINSATSVTVTFPTANPFTALSVGQFVNLGQLSSVGVPGRYAIASVSGLSVTFTVAGWPATGAGTLTLWGHSYHRIAYSGTVATNASYDAQRRGWATGDTVVTINTTAAPGHVGHLQGMGQMAGYADALAATNTAYQFTPRASRLENLPDDALELHLYIVARNGATAPASTTTLTVGFVSVEMTGRQKVYVAGGDQMGAPMSPLVTVVQPTAANLQATVTGTVTANIGTGALAAGANAIGDVGLQARANATGAMSLAKVLTAATTNATLVKATAGRVFGWTLTNTSAAIRVVRFHNLTVAPTVGTSVPAYVVAIPAGQTVQATFPVGIAHTTGISYSVTAAIADLDATATAANDVVGAIYFA